MTDKLSTMLLFDTVPFFPFDAFQGMIWADEFAFLALKNGGTIPGSTGAKVQSLGGSQAHPHYVQGRPEFKLVGFDGLRGTIRVTYILDGFMID